MFTIQVKKGRIVFSSAEAENKFHRLLLSYNDTGKILTVEIEEYSRKTTNDQMQLYKAIVAAGKEETGMSFSEFDQELVSNFAPYKYVTDILGKKVKERIRPEEMNNKQFQDFVQECIRFMKEFFGIDFKLRS